MIPLRTVLCSIIAISVAGCATPPSPPSAADRADRARIADQPVVLPATTPYDGDIARRTVYLEWYWFGYREGLIGTGGTFCGSEHPWNDIQSEGFRDGRRDGSDAYVGAMAGRQDE